MKNMLSAVAGLALAAALSGCVSPYPGIYSSGAYAGYDGGFDDGYHGYERPITWDEGYRQTYASYAPPFGYYPPQPAYARYPAYGPQSSGWYSTYYCPPQMGGY